MELSTDKCVFSVTDKMNQTRVGTHVAPLVLLFYPTDEELCILRHLKEYIKQTSHLRNGIKQLLLSHSKPHDPVITDTISRWCKAVPSTADVDVSKFKGHTTRAASTLFLAFHNISIKDIMMSAGWSNELTFQQYYTNQPSQSSTLASHFEVFCHKIIF